MLPSTRKFSIIVALLALPLCSFAVGKKEATKLAAISKEMYEQGNEKYLYVDFYKDGLLKDGDKFEVSYDEHTIVLNGKKLPEPYQTEYTRKRMQFLNEILHAATEQGVAKGTLHVKDIYNAKSCFRTNNSKPHIPEALTK